jgi:glycosyltransferase involved in cell wall biosynthesis
MRMGDRIATHEEHGSHALRLRRARSVRGAPTLERDVPDQAGNVWMVIPSFAPLVGGAESQVRRLSIGLTGRGWRVHVLTRRHGRLKDARLPRVAEVEGVGVIRVDSGGPGKIGSIQYLLAGLWHLGRHGRGAIYHAHDVGTPGLLAAAARRLFGGRSIVKLRTGRLNYEKQYGSGFGRWMFKRLLALHDRVIAVSTEVEGYLQEIGVPVDLVIRLPNAVDGAVFAPSHSSPDHGFRRSLGLSAGGRIILYIGRLNRVKGVDVLLDAWAALPPSLRHDTALLIVGDGEERAALERRASRLGIQESVAVVGEQSDVRAYYAAADLFVLPSRTEGLSNALLEAMACGIPVIASRVGGAPDVVEDGITGLLFESDDPLDLVARLEEMMSRRDEWRAMGLRARKRVLQYASYEAVLGDLIDVYRSLGHAPTPQI